jgi:crotonobetainyl-CoA:carnitine CoA-transferase CaiB-like acyl-CoA transferase
MTRAVPGPGGEPAEVLRTPLTFSDTPAGVRSGPPRPGAHGREILAEAGYSDDEVAALLEAGAVALEQAGRRWPTR